ncbi:protein MMS22-like isoform X1 [Pantherophis guttatus]|uniref:Protein MMS22-like n=1 Tax=Pantherophis guttatus TaxID=94885 RepID=A0A6P9B1V4_PANGU|nr:protein MMS22-like isoform X1 [Pantherophis guttatus]XP_034264929.1 protein MMS22-like isoform X1 [Pantherophis guttatus]
MDDDSSTHSMPFSFTESLEAAMEIEGHYSQILSFSCVSDLKSEGTSFSPDSYLASGSLKRNLLGLDPFPLDYEKDIVELFDFQWVTEIALVESCTFLFGLLRQFIYRLENLVQSSSSDFGQAANRHLEAHNTRQKCVEFLQYVKVFIFRYLEPHETEDELFHPYEKQEAQLPSLIVEELYSLTLHIGRLYDLPACILEGNTILPQSKLFPPSWHLLHLYIDIHWSVLEILHLLGEKMQRQTIYAHRFTNLTGENLTNISLFEDHCGNLLYDLISLSVKRYSKVRLSEALITHHYTCTCIKELWVLLIHLLDHRNKASLTESFWNWLNKILKKVFKKNNGTDSVSAFESIPCKDPLSFSWWIITHLASLYHIDRNGYTDEKKPVESNWPYVEDLLKQSVNNQAGILEEQLRMHLQCCLTLSHIWDVNLTIVTIVWEHYSKNLNNPFTIPWFGLKGLANISKTPLSMYELIKSYCNDIHTPDMYISCNSFQFFLRILAQIMKKAGKINGVHPWKQIKGRIYSKFHQKRMCELTEVGLQNFLYLFLVLAALAETEDVASRMMELLRFLSPTSTSVTQKALIWKGYFAFILTYIDKSMDIRVLAEPLSAAFCEKAKEFLVARNDLVQKQNLWMLLSTYVDGVQEVFESSLYLNLSEEKLMSDGFSMLLPGCRGAELTAVLNFLQAVLFRLRAAHEQLNQGLRLGNPGPNAQPSSVAKEHHLAVAKALWRNFFPYLKGQRMVKTPPPQLADTAAGLTLLALDLPSTCTSDLQPQPIISMMQLFGWDDMVCPQLVSRYLTHLIQNSALAEALTGMGHSSYQSLFVQSWFRCILQTFINQPPETLIRTDAEQTTNKAYMEQVTEFTRLIFKLPEVITIFSKAHFDESVYKQDPKEAVFRFIEAVGKNYSELQQLPEKSAMVTKALVYLGDILKYVKPYLVKKGPAEGLHLTYKIIGCLVKSWAAILATSKAQPLLFRIIDCLLLPHAVLQQDKELPAVMLAAIRENLPFFLQGLSFICCHCQSQSQSAYLNQLLRNVIHQYLGRFLLLSSRAGHHPILLALHGSAATPEAIHLHKTSVQVISENYLQFKGNAPPPRLGSVLAFTLEALQRTKSIEIYDVETLLPSVLKCLILVNEPQVKKLSTEILQYLVEGCQTRPGGELATQLISVFRQFIQDYTTVYDNQVYSILETVAILDQSLVVCLIPVMSEALRNSEHKQGLGRNTLQREAYKRLLSHLTEPGQMEILKLENESY